MAERITRHQSRRDQQWRLDTEPLLALDMRLDEGSGAVLAYDLLDAACALHGNMAIFVEAGVANRD